MSRFHHKVILCLENYPSSTESWYSVMSAVATTKCRPGATKSPGISREARSAKCLVLSLIFKKFWLKLKMKIKPTSARSRNRWVGSKAWPLRDRPCWRDFSRSSSFQGEAMGPQKRNPELVSSSLLLHPPTSREGPPGFRMRCVLAVSPFAAVVQQAVGTGGQRCSRGCTPPSASQGAPPGFGT